MTAASTLDEKRLLAALDLLRRTGACAVQLRHSDDDDPVVWLVIAEHRALRGRPVPADTKGARRSFAVGAGLTPIAAALRVCEELVDGGKCAHCGRPTAVDTESVPDVMPLPMAICWYQYDPELATFRRACEGDS